MKRLTAQAKIALIKRAQAGEKVAKICREKRVSRAIFYRWRKEFFPERAERVEGLSTTRLPAGRVQARNRSLKKHPHWKSYSPQTKRNILKLILKSPSF